MPDTRYLKRLTPPACLPTDADRALLVGRLWMPSVDGPALVLVAGDDLLDLSAIAPTSSELFDRLGVVQEIQARPLPRIASLPAALANASAETQDPSQPWLLAPCDLQAIKAAGVTFVASMLERVIEEQARGDPAKAEGVRRKIIGIVGDNLRSVRPGSAEAARVKDVLLAEGLWSQYLEVGIGPDAEIFTKSQPMSAVGTGADIGIHRQSTWNNPEPEIVLAINSAAARRSARRSATTSTCATSRGAARCCSARPRTTTRRARSARSSGYSTTPSRSMPCAAPTSR